MHPRVRGNCISVAPDVNGSITLTNVPVCWLRIAFRPASVGWPIEVQPWPVSKRRQAELVETSADRPEQGVAAIPSASCSRCRVGEQLERGRNLAAGATGSSCANVNHLKSRDKLLSRFPMVPLAHEREIATIGHRSDLVQFQVALLAADPPDNEIICSLQHRSLIATDVQQSTACFWHVPGCVAARASSSRESMLE
jgi:hypothetical protein